MNENLHLEIVTPFGKTFSEEVVSCIVPGVKGQFQILTKHAPVISNITIGAIKIQSKNKDNIFIATSGGFCEVRNNEIKIIVESAERSENIEPPSSNIFTNLALSSSFKCLGFPAPSPPKK